MVIGTLREKLVKIGARIVRHGRYVVFQLAEVALPRPDGSEAMRPAEPRGSRGPRSASTAKTARTGLRTVVQRLFLTRDAPDTPSR
jgi:hypothetical protein